MFDPLAFPAARLNLNLKLCYCWNARCWEWGRVFRGWTEEPSPRTRRRVTEPEEIVSPRWWQFNRRQSNATRRNRSAGWGKGTVIRPRHIHLYRLVSSLRMTRATKIHRCLSSSSVVMFPLMSEVRYALFMPVYVHTCTYVYVHTNTRSVA